MLQIANQCVQIFFA